MYSHSATASETYTFLEDTKNALVIFGAMNNSSDSNWYIGRHTVTSSSPTGEISMLNEGCANYSTYYAYSGAFKLSNFKKGDSIDIGNVNTCRIMVLKIN